MDQIDDVSRPPIEETKDDDADHQPDAQCSGTPADNGHATDALPEEGDDDADEDDRPHSDGRDIRPLSVHKRTDDEGRQHDAHYSGQPANSRSDDLAICGRPFHATPP